MSKASSAFRRGAVRLSSTFGSGHTALNLLISELSNQRQKHKDLLVAQTSASRRIHKWAQDEGIPALQDVLRQVSELNILWADAQRDFIAALKDYKRLYERILEMDKKLDQARKQLQSCEEKERKLQKEMVKGPKEVGLTQERLQQAVDAKNLAETEVGAQKRETDALKLASVRAGLLELSQAWASLGRKCTLLAESQMELAQLIPDVNTRLQEIPPYNESQTSQRIIYTARNQLDRIDPPSYSSAAVSSLPHSSSFTSSLPSYNSASRLSSRPSSAGSYGSREGTKKHPPPPSGLAPKLLQTLEQEDSFDSFESD